ncbi:MAG: transketolase, partial [Planctomycetes bacterium]|nr:transketolase [Planctomycetota bacterium]
MTNSKAYPGLSTLDETCVRTIRFLAMDAVQKANSGHPGMPMAMAPAAYTLWTKYLRHNPANPKWLNRDRFVLSAGHGCMLLYALLHLSGYDLSLDEIKKFRQWESKTPGHPEYGHTPGVEVTTGPLGQGISNAVGMAAAQKYLAAYFNRDKFPIFDYNIYVIVGDGDLQEGVASEACSLAGHLGLDNLIVLYDNNYISIDGNTNLSFTEDRCKRFEAYNWHVQNVEGDGNDMTAFQNAIDNAKQQSGKPNFIQFRTHIAFGSPNKQDTHGAHGSPLGDDEIKLIKKNEGWDPDQSFHVPEQALTHFRSCSDKGAKLEQSWNDLFGQYQKAHPDLAQQIQNAQNKKLPIDIDDHLPDFPIDKPLATRQASGMVLDALMPHMPLVLGGSADLTPSNNTRFKGAVDFQKDTPTGRYIRYGIREHAMGSIMNGIAVSDLLIPYGGTFLCFADYMRPAIRLAALSNYPTIFLFTHDSVGLGEDGPTHQPVEHFAALRAIPNLYLYRPAEANETAQAWKHILQNRDKSAVLILTRQALPILDQSKVASAANLTKGAYIVLADPDPQLLLLATGSELSIAMEAYEKLTQDGIRAQLVSMPCWRLFEEQPKEYQDKVLPPHITARVAIEAGVSQGWDKWLAPNGVFIGIDRFGASAPYKTIYKNLGLTPENVANTAKKLLTH